MMKIAYLITVVLASFSLRASAEIQSFCVSLANDSRQIQLAMFSYNGKFFDVGHSIEEERGAIDRSSPEALSRTIFKALSNRDVNLYANAYGLQPSEVGYTARDDNAVKAMQIVAEIKYGNMIILLMHLEMKSSPIEWTQPYYFTQRDGVYYAIKPAFHDKTIQLLASFARPGPKSAFKYLNKNSSSSLNISYTNYFENTTTNPIIVSFKGGDYKPNLRIDAETNIIDDHAKSLNDLVAMATKAAKAGDAHSYLKLISPNEIKLPINNATAETINDYVLANIANASKKINTDMLITRTVECQDDTIVFYKNSNDSSEFWISATKLNNEWYLTSLKGDKIQAALCYFIVQYFGLPITNYPNVFLVQ